MMQLNTFVGSDEWLRVWNDISSLPYCTEVLHALNLQDSSQHKVLLHANTSIRIWLFVFVKHFESLRQKYKAVLWMDSEPMSRTEKNHVTTSNSNDAQVK